MLYVYPPSLVRRLYGGLWRALCGFTHTPQGGAIEGNPDRSGTDDALMADQGRNRLIATTG